MTLDQLLGMQYFGPKRMEIIRGGSREDAVVPGQPVPRKRSGQSGAPAATPVTTTPPSANPSAAGDIRVTGLQPAGN